MENDKMLNTEAERARAMLSEGIIDSILGLFCVRTDDRLTIIYANSEFISMHGYACAEEMSAATGMSAAALVDADDLQRVLGEVRSSAAAGSASFDVLGKKKSGEKRWFHVRGVLDSTGGEERLYGLLLDVTLRREAEEKLRIRSEEYRIVIAQSGKMIIRYDVASRTAVSYFDSEKLFGFGGEVRDFPDALVSLGIVSDECVDEFRSFFDSMECGDPTGHSDNLLRRTDGTFGWYHSDYTMIYDGDGAPSYAILSIFDNTAQREKELAYDKWQKTRAAMLADSALYIEGNISKDVLERVDSTEELLTKDSDTFSGFVRLISKKCRGKDEAKRLREFFDRGRLLMLYESGVYEDNYEFCAYSGAEDENGRWYGANVQMVRYPYTDEIKAFAVFTDVSDRHGELERLSKRAERDALTGLYNRAELETRVRTYLDSADGGEAALFVVDVDNFKQVNDTMGHQAGDQALVLVGEKILKTFRASDVVGRLGGDEFMVFMPDCGSEDVAARKAKALTESLRLRICGADVTASVGVAAARAGSASFETLYAAADEALYKAKSSGKNCWSFSKL